jgi:hypothetical protein
LQLVPNFNNIFRYEVQGVYCAVWVIITIVILIFIFLFNLCFVIVGQCPVYIGELSVKFVDNLDKDRLILKPIA